MDGFFITSRILIGLFSVAVWHQHVNELTYTSDHNLESNECRLFNGTIGILFLLICLIHFTYTMVSFYFIKKEFVAWYAICNILLGAFLIMAIKPPDWYYSFKWEDCFTLYNNNDVIGRIAMFGYVLLTLGASELIYVVMLPKTFSVCTVPPNTFIFISRKNTFCEHFYFEFTNTFACTGCTMEKTTCSWPKALVLFLFAPVFYAICGLIVFICVDSG